MWFNTKKEDGISFIPSFQKIVKEKHLNVSKINISIPANKQSEPHIENRYCLYLNDGKHVEEWHIDSLREMFRGEKHPPKNMDHYPEEYCGMFFSIEKNILWASGMINDTTDDEFVRLFNLIKRRPDGRSEGFMHDVIYQSAALMLGLQPLSQAEFEAIFMQLARSAKNWRQGYASRNYIHFLRDNLVEEQDARIEPGKKILLNKIKKTDYLPENLMLIDSDNKKEKMSKIILDFAKPLTDVADGDESVQGAIELSIGVWNLSLLPYKEQQEMLDNLIDVSSVGFNGDKEATRDCFNMLLKRKKKYFSDNKRIIQDFHFNIDENGMQLNVSSLS